MKLLVSVKSVDEVEAVVEGGADIVDVKDPETGSLGLPDLDVVKYVVSKVRSSWDKEVSIALGDINKYDRMLKYVVFVGCALGADYVKIGLATNSFDMATKIAKEAKDVVSSFKKTSLVVVGYADYAYVNTLEPLKVIDIATKVEADGVMIDTLRKNGLSTFDLLSINYIHTFVEKAHSQDFITAIAGGIKIFHLSLCAKLGFDVVGVRGSVCAGGRSDKVSRELVQLFRKEIDRLKNIV